MSNRSRARAAAKQQVKAADGEGKALCIGLFREVNSGWIAVELELPKSVVEKYATSISAPDLKQLVVAKLVLALERFTG